MENKPIISIIMSNYNGEKYIEEAIKSILNQSFKNFEFIIFDDGSTDKSKKIIKNYEAKDNRINAFYNKKNRGYKGFIKNLNRGIKMSKGKYIARMDSDDISTSNRLIIQYKFLENNPQIDILGTSYKVINENGKELFKEKLDYNEETIKKIILKKDVIAHPSVMMKKLPEIYYREKVPYCEDYDLWLRMLTLNKKIVIIPEILLKYRIHNLSTSVSKSIKQRIMAREAINWYFQRKNLGRDSYNKFKPDALFNTNKNEIEKEEELNLLKNKFLEKNLKNFRNSTIIFWKKYSFISWPQGIIYYLISYLPIKIKSILNRGIKYGYKF